MKNQKVNTALLRVLADTVSISLKTLCFHWSVTGPFFTPLHKLFEEQYKELLQAADEIAEQIKANNGVTPAGMVDMLKPTGIVENKDAALTWRAQLHALLKDHESIVKTLNNALEVAAGHKDEPSADLIIDRVRAHEKIVWILKAHLEDK